MILETHRVNNNDDDRLNEDIQCNGSIIEKECSVGFVPDQSDKLLALPNGKDVLDDPIFYSNDNSIGNEADVGNDGVPGDNDNYGVIYDRTDDSNPPSLPQEPNMPCVHSTTITNDGKTLPPFSLVYQVEQSDEVNTLIDKVYQVEQSDEVNTLIDEINEEYCFSIPTETTNIQLIQFMQVPKKDIRKIRLEF